MKYKKEIAAVGIVFFSVIASVIGYSIFGERLEYAVPVINTLSPERMSELGFTETSKIDDSDMWEENVTDTETAGTENSTVFPLDINLADLDDLMKIKGIGKVTAQNIINYRDDYGYFYSLDELLNVSGIGEKKLADLKKFVYISDEFAAEAETVTTSVPAEKYTSKTKALSKTAIHEKTTKSVKETKKRKTVKTSAEDDEYEELFEDDEELIEEYINNDIECIDTASEYSYITETEYTPSFPLELNSATVQDLVCINGIGKAMAQKIVDYGRTDGFYEVEDLLNVNGIGESTLRKIAPYVYADSSGLPPKNEYTDTEYAPSFPLELNSATVRDLVCINGISNAIAQKIVDYGRTDGFYEVEDLLNVSGIGESTLRKIAQYVYADSSGLPPKNENTDTEYVTSFPLELNSATVRDLICINGIGMAMAQKIVDYGRTDGFYEVEDLLNVNGIGESTLKKIAPYFYVDSSGLPPKNENTGTEYDPAETTVSESDFSDFSETETSQTEAQIYSININTATKEDFMQLPGIDETTAENLIKLREEISGFLKIEEMIYADGMTTDKIEMIRAYVYL